MCVDKLDFYYLMNKYLELVRNKNNTLSNKSSHLDWKVWDNWGIYICYNLMSYYLDHLFLKGSLNRSSYNLRQDYMNTG